MRRLAKDHDIWLATHLQREEEIGGVPHLKTFCTKVATGLLERKHPLAHVPGLMAYGLAGRPLELKFLRSPDLEAQIQAWALSTPFDIVQIEESRMALYLECFDKAVMDPRTVLTFYDIAFHQAARISRLKQPMILKWRAWIQGKMMRRWEPRYAQRFDRCIVVSEGDRRLLAEANGTLDIDVVPNGVDTRDYEPLPYPEGSKALLFIGSMDYPPCIDAMLYFCESVLPLVREKIPDIELWIVGSNPVPAIQNLDGPGIHVTGQVPLIEPYYARSTVAVVPLRGGSGTRLKILEAMALGRPVVSTTLGREGLDVQEGEHLLVADAPRAFADHIIRLLSDRALWQKLVRQAREQVAEYYDWDALADQMRQIYTELQTEATRAR
jgi:sugar transferase (PEP-CTERM/EpsH1 system associated)